MSTPANELQENGFYLAKGVVPQAKLDEIFNEVKDLSKLLGATGSSYHEIWNSLVDVDRSRGGLIYNAVKKLPSVNSLPGAGIVEYARKNLFVERPAIVDVNFRIDAPAEDKFSFDWHQDYWFSMCSPYALVAWTPLVPTDDEITEDSNLDVFATYRLPPIPTPPVTVKAPVPDEIAIFELVNLEESPTNREPPIPTPPVTVNAPVPTDDEIAEDSNLDVFAT